jgi:hypothetical protein
MVRDFLFGRPASAGLVGPLGRGPRGAFSAFGCGTDGFEEAA